MSSIAVAHDRLGAPRQSRDVRRSLASVERSIQQVSKPSLSDVDKILDIFDTVACWAPPDVAQQARQDLLQTLASLSESVRRRESEIREQLQQFASESSTVGRSSAVSREACATHVWHVDRITAPPSPPAGVGEPLILANHPAPSQAPPCDEGAPRMSFVSYLPIPRSDRQLPPSATSDHAGDS